MLPLVLDEVDEGDPREGLLARGLLEDRGLGDLDPDPEPDDDEDCADRLVAKLLKLRIFADEAGKMNRSVADAAGGLLVVSQFTLAADTSGGNRPSFTGAAPPDLGRRLYERVLATARASHPTVACGEFGADMQVHLVNDGPVTIPLRINRRTGPLP